MLPELICSDLSASLTFYRLLGFEIGYERPDERFVYLVRGGAALMLEQPLVHDRSSLGPSSTTPTSRRQSLDRRRRCQGGPAAVVASDRELFLALEERWYGRTEDSVGVLQFAVQDPDGYLLRISQDLGTRPRPDAPLTDGPAQQLGL